MSKLEELIQQYCPDGVEYIKLDDYFIQLNGMTGVSNKWADEGNCVFIDYMNAYKNIKIDVSALNYATVKNTKQTVLKKGDVLFTSASETPDECALASEIEDDIQDNVFMDDHLFGLRLKDEFSDLYARGFLKYVFRSEYFRRVVNKVVRGVTRFYISKTDFMRLEVPLPALPVQREIVRILDEFSLLSAELAAELAARKKQFQHYLDELYKPKQGWKKYELNELGTLTRGKRFVKADAVEDGIPCIHYGELYTHYGVVATEVKSHIRADIPKKLRYAKKNDVVIVGAGENDWDIGVGVAWLGEKEIAVHDACYTFNHEQNPLFISYYLRTTDYHQQIKKYVSTGKICAISAEGIGKSIIYIPDIKQQEIIANQLNSFNDLINSISEGLPAEIEARQKQYEYYRDKLLKFERKGE